MTGMIETEKKAPKNKQNSGRNGEKRMAVRKSYTLEWTEDGVTREIKVYGPPGLSKIQRR